MYDMCADNGALLAILMELSRLWPCVNVQIKTFKWPNIWAYIGSSFSADLNSGDNTNAMKNF